MAKKKATVASEGGEVVIRAVQQQAVRLFVLGRTPLIMNRMSAKVKQGLLVGGKKKTAAEKATIKHHPYREYREAAYTVREGPTALGMPVTAFKDSMCDAAIETGGVTKASCQRLLSFPGDFTAVYGVPRIFMTVVRSADQARTPDVRTRPILPSWGAELTIQYVTPQLNWHSVMTLLVNAGILITVGDNRQQKGKGSYGSFDVTADDKDPRWLELVATGGREAQMAALENPEPYNDETRELLDFYDKELIRRPA